MYLNYVTLTYNTFSTDIKAQTKYSTIKQIAAFKNTYVYI